MADDPYAVLGVSKSASEDDIRRAFRKLAKECHPDLHPGNTGAADRFKRVTAAYEIVGDAERRKAYDRGEIDASGEPRRQYHHAHPRGGARTAGGRHDDFAFGDIFSEMFGDAAHGGREGGRPGFARRGADVRYTLEVDFLEAARGTKKRVTMPEGGVLDLTVPVGVSDGQVLRLRGKGGAGLAGGASGDALVEIHVKQSAEFKRSGFDILVEVPVTIDEAVLGARIEVPTVEGRVALTIPKGTSSGRVFRLKGKGIANPAAGTTGDQLVSIRIVLPETVDDTLSYFLTEWRQKHRYDPGRK
jgi:DnaJ-class molecular chaperone